MYLLKNKKDNNMVEILEDVFLENIDKIHHNQGQQAVFVMNNNEEILTQCINCVNPKCINIETKSIDCKLKYYPYDKSTNLCPMNAITKEDGSLPAIDYDLCINCGLCIKACPLGAIFFNDNGNIEISSSNGDLNTDLLADKTNLHENQINILSKIDHTGEIISTKNISKQLSILYSNIKSKVDLTDTNFSNKISDRVLNNIGVNSWISRKGDVYNRMDGVIKQFKQYGVLEIEFSEDSLGAIRTILDDISMLNHRYDVNSNLSLIIFLELPNNRQGFWQVSSDIYNVLGLKIKTVTLGYLFEHLWLLTDIDLTSDKLYLHEKCKYLYNKNQNESLGIYKPIK